ncbi:MAG: glycosyltransferase family 39 protein [Polyangiaceae bacterium]
MGAGGARSLPSSGALVLAIAALTPLLQAATWLRGDYGYFIDELYYLACADHPALGYVDHPPLSIWVLSAVRAVLGSSVPAIRLVPALAAGAVVWLLCWMARFMGGGRTAVVVTGIAATFAPLLLVIGSFHSMNILEVLSWVGMLAILLRLASGHSPRLWLALGAMAGLAFLNKHTVSTLLVGLAVATLLTPALRATLRTRWPWLAGLLALGIALPNLVWQLRHDWVSLEFYRQAHAQKNVVTPPLGVLKQQLELLGPLSAPLWLTGAGWLWAARVARPFRPLVIVWSVLLTMLVLSQASRPDRIGGAALALFPAGAVAVERAAQRVRALRYAVPALRLAGGLPMVPFALSLLAPPRQAAYAAWLGLTPQLERGRTSPLPQWLADRTGWETYVDQVRAVVATLGPEERAAAVIYVDSYGLAGALQRFAPDLPPVLCNHNSYWYWGRDWLASHGDPRVVVGVLDSPDDLAPVGEPMIADRVRCAYCMSWRRDRPIVVVRAGGSLRPLWPRLRHLE